MHKPQKGGMFTAALAAPGAVILTRKFVQDFELEYPKAIALGTALSAMLTESLKNIAGLDFSSVEDLDTMYNVFNSACFGVREALSLNQVQFVMHKTLQLLGSVFGVALSKTNPLIPPRVASFAGGLVGISVAHAFCVLIAVGSLADLSPKLVVYLAGKVIEPISDFLCAKYDSGNKYCSVLTNGLVQMFIWMTMDVWKSMLGLWSIGKLGYLFVLNTVVEVLLPAASATKEMTESIAETTIPEVWKSAQAAIPLASDGIKLVISIAKETADVIKKFGITVPTFKSEPLPTGLSDFDKLLRSIQSTPAITLSLNEAIRNMEDYQLTRLSMTGTEELNVTMIDRLEKDVQQTEQSLQTLETHPDPVVSKALIPILEKLPQSMVSDFQNITRDPLTISSKPAWKMAPKFDVPSQSDFNFDALNKMPVQKVLGLSSTTSFVPVMDANVSGKTLTISPTLKIGSAQSETVGDGGHTSTFQTTGMDLESNLGLLGATVGLLYKYKYNKSSKKSKSKKKKSAPSAASGSDGWSDIQNDVSDDSDDSLPPPLEEAVSPFVLNDTPTSTVYQGAVKVDYVDGSGQPKQDVTPVAITVDKSTSQTTAVKVLPASAPTPVKAIVQELNKAVSVQPVRAPLKETLFQPVVPLKENLFPPVVPFKQSSVQAWSSVPKFSQLHSLQPTVSFKARRRSIRSKKRSVRPKRRQSRKRTRQSRKSSVRQRKRSRSNAKRRH